MYDHGEWPNGYLCNSVPLTQSSSLQHGVRLVGMSHLLLQCDLGYLKEEQIHFSRAGQVYAGLGLECHQMSHFFLAGLPHWTDMWQLEVETTRPLRPGSRNS